MLLCLTYFESNSPLPVPFLQVGADLQEMHGKLSHSHRRSSKSSAEMQRAAPPPQFSSGAEAESTGGQSAMSTLGLRKRED